MKGQVMASSKLTLREESGVEIVSVRDEWEAESSVLLLFEEGQKNRLRLFEEVERMVGAVGEVIGEPISLRTDSAMRERILLKATMVAVSQSIFENSHEQYERTLKKKQI